MATPRLHPDTIEEVRARADIVDVVSDQVVLKKRGKDLVGLCPFHDDKNNPSFTVSPAKQFYYCFACGAGGNAIKFLMEINKTDFTDVVLDLAKRYQIPVKTLEPEKRQELQRQLSLREQLYEILAVTAKFYEHALRQPQGVHALDYLHNQRQLSDATISQFQLGYAPAGWSTLYSYLVEQKRYPVALVEQAGLIVPRKAAHASSGGQSRSGDGYYDRFRDRLMIPIHDLQRRVIAFGGRTLTGEEPKYLNSPETELFDKGKTLFGLDQARGAIAKQDRAVVVEGYFDVISLHAAGVTQAVAALGTALSLHQVKQLLRYTESKRIVLNFDADGAGQRAAARAIGEVEDLAYQGQVELRVLNLPDGKDADEFLRQFSGAAYEDLLDHSALWLDWQIQQIVVGKDLKQADQFQQAVQGLVKLLGKLPNTPIRTRYIHHCAELLSQNEARMALQLEEDLRQQVRGQRWHGQSNKWERPGDYNSREAAEATLLRLYLHAPGDRFLVRQSLRERDLSFSLAAHRWLWTQIRRLERISLGNTWEEQLIAAIAEGITETAGDWQSPWQDKLADLDLITPLRDSMGDMPSSAATVLVGLVSLNELTQSDLQHSTLVIRGAVATIERIQCEKRCRHLLDAWQRQPVQSVERCVELLLSQDLDPTEDAADQIEQLYHQLNQETLQFQKLFYDQRQYLNTLDNQRRVSSLELLGVRSG